MATRAEQNFKVSATGGAGASGQGKKYIPGMRDMGSTGVETMAQQGGATMAKSSMPSSISDVAMPKLGTFLDPTDSPSEPISAGSDFGRGVDSSALPKDLVNNTRPDENQTIIKNYLPDLLYAASSPDAPDSFKRFVNYLAAQ